MPIYSTSAIASDFPTVPVEIEDMLASRIHRTHGRSLETGIDCLGVVLEVYRRAGLGLPDPALGGTSLEEFEALFDEVQTADTLFDIIKIAPDDRAGRGSMHLYVIPRDGIAISSRDARGVYTVPAKIATRIRGARFYRVKPSALP